MLEGNSDEYPSLETLGVMFDTRMQTLCGIVKKYIICCRKMSGGMHRLYD